VSASRAQRLEQGIEALALNCSGDQRDSLLAYLDMLERWNKAFNLTAVRDPLQMIGLHLLDSLAVHPHIQDASTIIDVGSGAGLPGIPLSILNPQKKFTLLDSNGKKTRFLFQVISQLGLTNVQQIHSRVEAYTPRTKFDRVISRAFSSIPDMLQQCHHLIADEGTFLAMKGKNPKTELSKIAKAYNVVGLIELKVPQIVGERHLVSIKSLPN
jgi:16S rRNA (guanine527-N7)-methyltransferase